MTRFRKEIFTYACIVHTAHAPKKISNKERGLKTVKEPHICPFSFSRLDKIPRFFLLFLRVMFALQPGSRKNKVSALYLKGFHNEGG